VDVDVDADADADGDAGRLLDGTEYRQMLSSLLEFIVGDTTYLRWLSEGVLPSEIENGTIIGESRRYPPLIIDPFEQMTGWLDKTRPAQCIDFDDKCVFERERLVSTMLRCLQIEPRHRHEHRTGVSVGRGASREQLSATRQSSPSVGSVDGHAPAHAAQRRSVSGAVGRRRHAAASDSFQTRT
jgi:hypothetical protein